MLFRSAIKDVPLVEMPDVETEEDPVDEILPSMVVIEDVPKECPLTKRIRPVVSESSTEYTFPTEVDLLPEHI